MVVRALSNDPDKLRVRETCRVDEALANAVASSRPGHDELHLGKASQGAVVQIDAELEREEIADRRITAQNLENVAERSCRGNAIRRLVVHDLFEKAKVIPMLSGISERR